MSKAGGGYVVDYGDKLQGVASGRGACAASFRVPSAEEKQHLERSGGLLEKGI
jgi:hypothetical protein